ncbi:protoporphyrinogen oxidase [Metabacillus fastidiosus]|uniref:Coproporphyrinogen III oxidase n=1 Tax=Metabacillus fastidiosus TaxID=1458 RepID=A0ABU6P1E1_9BACI|nr:protoporphyrinogen oxidase [Metabacillus fastidiosus]MED4403096.1 protoporphyrinogen oxidase [Metabacillus fastidiosus]MED4461521.1 protoporphyrinogen oxidase [Metabacillus fastidiosus]
MTKQKVVIIGGGITGLSAAFYLQKEMLEKNLPIEIKLVEANEKLGGKIQTIRHEDFVIERGPDSFLERKTSAAQLVKDVGLGDQLVNNAVGRSFILVNDELNPIPAGAVMGIPTKISPFISSKLFSLQGKARAAADFIIPAGKPQDDQSLGHFFRRRLGNEVVENLIEPLLSGIYAGDIDKLSLMSTFPQFYKVEQENRSLILGMKKSTPVNSQKHKPNKGIFLTLKGGLESLVAGVEKKLTHTAVLKNCKVASIKKIGEQYELKFEDNTIEMADTIVMTSPHYTVPQMISNEPIFEYLKEIPATTVGNIAMAFPEGTVKLDKEGTGFVISRNADFTITACTWVHKKWKHSTPGNKLLLRAFFGKPGDSEIVHKSDEEILKIVLKDLNKVTEITAEPEFYYVSRWKQAMPQYNVGHIEKVRKLKSELGGKYPGLYLAGAPYEGVGLPDCIDQGKAAVDDVLQYLSNKMKMEAVEY